VVDNEIVMASSASLVAALRARRIIQAVPPKAVIVFADPVFDSSDPRVHKGNRPGKQSPELIAQTRLIRAFPYDSGWKRTGIIPRLPSTRDEAETIRNMVAAGEADVALDFDANRTSALRADLGKYRIVHFATHALIDTQTPELSGVILSLVDKDGQPEDGFFRLDDIANLRLAADLVVLSACNTDLGRDLKGEGIMGLSQGFLQAGANSVLSTLWKVDDEASAALIKRFYVNLLQMKESPAAALRSAQSWMAEQERWNAPYYWAAFVLQGDWN
jgi:CHAT domain-containing protein